MDLVLASTSPYRRVLLERLGLAFRCRAPRIDEDVWKRRGLSPRKLADQLAVAKAESLIAEEPAAILIGSDQLVAFEGRILGKPGNSERAVEQLFSMSGKTHELITALAVWHDGTWHTHTDIATLQFRSLTRLEIERYVEADRPLDCAGAYKLESLGITLFDRITCADHSAITGLPLIALTSILRDLGGAIP
ncbi:nucleoside triphosphate pyrophosphatase [soil metagenome]